MRPFKPTPASILVLAFVLLLALSLQAGDKPEEPSRTNEERVVSQKAMVQEIRGLLAESQVKIAALTEEMDAVTRESEAAILQGKIDEIKRGVEIQALEIQLRQARLEGREGTAIRLETALAGIRKAAAESRAATIPVQKETR